MASTSQNPLLGASKIEVCLNTEKALVNAELGGLHFIKCFLYFLPPALGVIMVLSFLLFGLNDPKVFGITLASFLPWLFIVPYLVSSLKKKVDASLNRVFSSLQSP